MEGARQQVQDWDPEENGGHPVSYTNAGEGEDQKDAFEKFEKASTSKQRALTASERLAQLEEHSEERWSDPYVLNRSLRKALRVDKGKMKEKRVRDDELADRYGLGDSVRLDLVRGAEDRVEGDGAASWLSRGEKQETSQTIQDGEEWANAQVKRRRLQMAEQDTKTILAAQTGWKDGKAPKPASVPSSSARIEGSSRKTSTSAVSRLKTQLSMNSARKADPFLSGLSTLPSTSIFPFETVSVKSSRK